MKAKPKRKPGKPGWDHSEVVNIGKLAQLENEVADLDKAYIKSTTRHNQDIQDLKLKLQEMEASVTELVRDHHTLKFEIKDIKMRLACHIEAPPKTTPFIPKAYYWVRRDKWVVFQATADGSRLYSPIFEPVLEDSHLNVHIIPEPKE